MIVNKITANLILNIVKSNGLPTSVDSEGRILMTWVASDCLNHNLDICFEVKDDNVLYIFGSVYDFKYDEALFPKALYAVNEYNKSRSSVTAFAMENDIVVSRTERIDKTVSEAFVEYCIGTTVVDIVKAFVYFENRVFS